MPPYALTHKPCRAVVRVLLCLWSEASPSCNPPHLSPSEHPKHPAHVQERFWALGWPSCRKATDSKAHRSLLSHPIALADTAETALCKRDRACVGHSKLNEISHRLGCFQSSEHTARPHITGLRKCCAHDDSVQDLQSGTVQITHCHSCSISAEAAWNSLDNVQY